MTAAAPCPTCGALAPSGESVEARKLAAAIAHRVIDHFNSTPSEEDEDEDRDDWCIVRDIAYAVLNSADAATAPLGQETK